MIANELVKEDGFTVFFVSLFEESDVPFFDIDSKIKRYTVYPAPTHGIQYYFDTVTRLKRLVERQHIDVIIDIDGILDMYSLPLKYFTGGESYLLGTF